MSGRAPAAGSAGSVLRQRVAAIGREWVQDRLLRRVLRNSSYLFASNVISALLSILTANMLGVAGFGILGAVTQFVSNVNRLLSFRMGDLVVRYMGGYLQHGDNERAAALVKVAGLVEALTSLAAYGVLAMIAPLGARYFTADPSLTPLFLVFGLSILGNITTETATGVLQVGNHYRSQALINLVQSVVTALIIIYAYLTHAGLVVAVIGYLVGKMILGLAPIVTALYWLPRMLGRDWWKARLSVLPPWRELARFGISTNLSATINMVARDSEVLWVNFFFSPTQGGYVKTAIAIINLMVMPITPFISTTYPELIRHAAARQWGLLRRLLRRVTLIAAGWTGAVVVGLLLIGRPILFQSWLIFGRVRDIYGPEFLPSFTVVLILLVGYGLANILFWNRPLLLALGLPDYPLKVMFWGMLVKVTLTILLVPRLGYLCEAALLSAYFAVTVGLIVARGLAEIRRRELQDNPA